MSLKSMTLNFLMFLTVCLVASGVAKSFFPVAEHVVSQVFMASAAVAYGFVLLLASLAQFSHQSVLNGTILNLAYTLVGICVVVAFVALGSSVSFAVQQQVAPALFFLAAGAFIAYVIWYDFKHVVWGSGNSTAFA